MFIDELDELDQEQERLEHTKARRIPENGDALHLPAGQKMHVPPPAEDSEESA